MFVWECPPAFLKDRVESLKKAGWKFNAELVACNAGSDVYRVTAYHWGVFSHGRTTTTAWPDAWIGAVVSAEERTPQDPQEAVDADKLWESGFEAGLKYAALRDTSNDRLNAYKSQLREESGL